MTTRSRHIDFCVNLHYATDENIDNPGSYRIPMTSRDVNPLTSRDVSSSLCKKQMKLCDDKAEARVTARMHGLIRQRVWRTKRRILKLADALIGDDVGVYLVIIPKGSKKICGRISKDFVYKSVDDVYVYNKTMIIMNDKRRRGSSPSAEVSKYQDSLDNIVKEKEESRAKLKNMMGMGSGGSRVEEEDTRMDVDD